MSLNKFIYLLFVFFFSLVVHSQSIKSQQKDFVKKDSIKAESLEDVVITATRTKRQLSTVPMPVTLVSKNDIKESNTLRLNNILQEQTGLIVVNDHGQGIQMQGMDASYTMVMINGVPLVGRTAGTFDLDRIAVGNIEQLEIVKGPSSSLYGSEAMAGVINIITPLPKKGIHGALSGMLQTNNTQDYNGELSYRNKTFTIKGFANFNSSDGYDLDKNDADAAITQAPFSRNTYSVDTRYNVSKNTEVSYYGRLFHENGESISNSFKGESNIVEQNHMLRFNHKVNNQFLIETELYYTNYFAESYTDDLEENTRSESDYDQKLFRPEVRGIYTPNKDNTLLLGGGTTHQSLDRTYFSNKPVFNAPYAYFQYDTKIWNRLNMVVGARYDAHNKYKSQFSPKLAASLKISDKIAIKGSVGRGYTAPDFRHLYLDFTNPSAGYSVVGYNRATSVIPQMVARDEIKFGQQTLNPNRTLQEVLGYFDTALKPESSWGYNVSVTFKSTNHTNITVNGFLNKIKDMIDSYPIGQKENNQSLFSYQNFNQVTTRGIELNALWKPNSNLRFLGGYQYLETFDKDAIKAFKNGVESRRTGASLLIPSVTLYEDDYLGLPNRSKHTFNAKAFYKIPKTKITLNTRVIYRSEYAPFGDTNGNGYADTLDTKVKGYALVNAAGNIKIYKKMAFNFGVNNLFNLKKRLLKTTQVKNFTPITNIRCYQVGYGTEESITNFNQQI